MKKLELPGYTLVINIKKLSKGGVEVSSKSSEEEIVGMIGYNIFNSIIGFFKTVYYGIKRIKEKKSNLYYLGMFTALGIGLFLLREKIWVYIPLDNKRMLPLKYTIYITPLLPVFYLWFCGEEQRRFISSFDEKFDEIGLFTKGKKKNFDGDMVERKVYPRYLGEEKEGDITTYSFHSNIPLDDWKAKSKNLEIIMDCNILKIDNALHTKKVVKVRTVPASKIIPIYADWKDSYLSDKDFEIIVGENMLEQIKFNFNGTPHVLVAGETGSGKSVILRLILRQAVLKAAKIFMIDFKGGVEFGIRYERYGEVITERQRALTVLKELTLENEVRLNLFRKMDVKNLAQYNNRAEKNGWKKLCRIVVFCDEVAEMMDKSGLRRDEKKTFEEIEKEVSTLARLARATGINLVLGMQRPDAKVLPGQIKNNIPVRISGRFADKPASEIVLSNSRATELPEVKGRFLFKVGADTQEFQAYNFDDDKMLTDVESVKGGMLTQNLDDEDAGNGVNTEAEVKSKVKEGNQKMWEAAAELEDDLEDLHDDWLPFGDNPGPAQIVSFADEEYVGFDDEEDYEVIDNYDEDDEDDEELEEVEEEYEGF